jgi:S-adenosylmethionine:tRNA ribosyltransferase-isomerase
LKLSEFDYPLPPDRIAQVPAAARDAARLLVLDGSADEPRDAIVSELPHWLKRGDLVVVNDSRVFPARLRGKKSSGGAVEALLLSRQESNPDGSETWTALLGASRMPREGARLRFGEHLVASVLEPPGDDRPALLRLELSPGDEARAGRIAAAIEACGEIPLPPYIHREGDAVPGDRERYQTVFARETGSAAAPTAGLHFTPDLLARLDRAGIGTAPLTLHVGLGTFAPVRVEEISWHRMHAEWFSIPAATARRVEETRAAGGRVEAVGTTVTRALEHSARTGAREGWCDLFITPGFEFARVDALLTNFHLPRSTLLMLVSAFAGRERILAAYRTAIERGYRFYSYGDAMLVTARP